AGVNQNTSSWSASWTRCGTWSLAPFSPGDWNSVSSVDRMSAISMAAIRLTRYSHGAGWACKLGPAELAQVLRHVPVATDPRILVDASRRDDAAVFQVAPDPALV